MSIPIRQAVRTAVFLLLIVALSIGETPTATSAPASVEAPASIQIEAAGSGVTFRWHAPAGGDGPSAASLAEELPLASFNGYTLPMHIFSVAMSDRANATAVQVSHLESIEWTEDVPRADLLKPLAIGWEPSGVPLAQAEAALPTSPLFVLREGVQRDTSIMVLAFSQIYYDQPTGTVRLVTDIEASVPDAIPWQANEASELVVADSGFGAAAVQESAPGPRNAPALRQSVKIIVLEAGIQRITGAALADVGLPNPSAAKLQLWYLGAEAPLHVIDVNGDGTLNATDEIRFYTEQPGDRWNFVDLYWLTVEPGNGLRMASRAVTPQDGIPARTTAMERGLWDCNKVYDSKIPGADGDHWFCTDTRVDASMKGPPDDDPKVTAELGNRLPLAIGASEKSEFALIGSTDSNSLNVLSVQIGATTSPLAWESVENGVFERDWEQTIENNARSSTLVITHVPDDEVSILKLDKVRWKQPVDLDFGGKGASFSGVPGTWRYTLSNTPGGRYVYDITDPLSPVLLNVAAGASFTMQDGPAVHDYIVTGDGTLHAPVVKSFAPLSFPSSVAYDAIFVAPTEFHATLQRLVNHRKSQGYQVLVVNPIELYDAWNYGFIHASAIRDFFRYAYFNWSKRPLAAVLVGDSSWDPLGYTGKVNKNIIPSYFAEVDPWLGETACENCFVQLNGEDPLDESAFLEEMWLGRFPVETNAELDIMIDKIISYENASDLSALWRSQSLFLADNYFQPDGTKDKAGNFAQFSDNVIDLQPRSVVDIRVYFDPYPLLNDPGGSETWRESNPTKARVKAFEAMNRGAGLVTYNGHSHHEQWAVTDSSVVRPYLFNSVDVSNLTNKDALFIGLSMTCFTSQFTKTYSDKHTTLDEELVLHANGGAVMVWGPAGLSVASGHDYLQTGFHEALWSKPPLSARMGELVEAGYTHLVTTGTCCQDVGHTFVLLGDPLTKVRVNPIDRLYMPLLAR